MMERSELTYAPSGWANAGRGRVLMARCCSRVLLGILSVSGCAYPQKVKDAAVAQGALIEQIKQTADAIGRERVEALAQTGRLAFQGAVAGECSALLEEGCGRGGCLSSELVEHLVTVGDEEADPFRATAAQAALQSEVLDDQLALMRRAQETIAEYVGTDVTIGEDEIKALNDAAAALDKGGSGDGGKAAGPANGGVP
jgi:hypothetical protein